MSDAVIYEKDIISELAVSVICNLNELRYRINAYDAPKHPLSVLLTTLFELKEVELDYGNTMDEVEQIEAKYEFASELINIVKDAYNIGEYREEKKLYSLPSLTRGLPREANEALEFLDKLKKAVYPLITDTMFIDRKNPMDVLNNMLFGLYCDIISHNYEEGKFPLIIAKLEFSRDYINNIRRSRKVEPLYLPDVELPKSAIKSDYLLQRDVDEACEELFGVFTPLVVSILHYECINRIYDKMHPILIMRAQIQKTRRKLLCSAYSFGELHFIRAQLQFAADLFNYVKYANGYRKTDFNFYMTYEDEVDDGIYDLPTPNENVLKHEVGELSGIVSEYYEKTQENRYDDTTLIAAIEQKLLAMMFDNFGEDDEEDVDLLAIDAKLRFAHELLDKITNLNEKSDNIPEEE